MFSYATTNQQNYSKTDEEYPPHAAPCTLGITCGC